MNFFFFFLSALVRIDCRVRGHMTVLGVASQEDFKALGSAFERLFLLGDSQTWR
jgi:hypothetical protein